MILVAAAPVAAPVSIAVVIPPAAAAAIGAVFVVRPQPAVPEDENHNSAQNNDFGHLGFTSLRDGSDPILTETHP